MGSTYRGDLKELLTSAIGALKRVRQFFPPSTVQTMYNSLIHLYFDYFKSVVWEVLGSELGLTLQKLQKPFPSPFPLLIELGWDNLSVSTIKVLAIEI